ncbi:MAG TPA: 4-(cytidine 5'-diphospho)-2-C-methyl-D-erythritol kinase [Syntrophobacteria bacterium]|nr:4-(cytidine 5'-diphospho)-2-C-methyl-D-erythritol kinase [Syntrophobacteria bacterium]
MFRKHASAPPITLRAPAKINLGLRVLGRRADGYHDILSLMVPVGLYDVVLLESGKSGVDLRCPDSDLPTDNGNLVYRAARLVLNECRSSAGVRLELRKGIPVGAGLGGGSSDGAATLRGVNELLGRPLRGRDLHRLAVSLGADVPFFLLGCAAVAEGIGDRLMARAGVPEVWTLLAYPGFQVSTRWAYEHLTLTTGANASSIKNPVRIPAGDATAYRERLFDGEPLTLDDLLPILVNDFEPLLFSHFPQLGEIRRALLAAGARAAPMSGSGPTLVGLFASEAEAYAARDQVGRRPGVVLFVARTMSEDIAQTEKLVTPL